MAIIKLNYFTVSLPAVNNTSIINNDAYSTVIPTGTGGVGTPTITLTKVLYVSPYDLNRNLLFQVGATSSVFSNIVIFATRMA